MSFQANVHIDLTALAEFGYRYSMYSSFISQFASILASKFVSIYIIRNTQCSIIFMSFGLFA